MSLGLLSPKNDMQIDMVSPVNWLHPLARGLGNWWLCVPGQQSGPRWNDLCQRNHGTLTNISIPSGAASGWNPTARRGGWGEMRIDGTGDYVESSGLCTLGAEFTLSFWIWCVALASFDCIMDAQDGSGGPGFAIIFDASGHLYYTRSGTGGAGGYALASSALTTGVWQHIVGTHRQGVFTFYKNGLAITTTPNGSQAQPTAGTGPLRIGGGSRDVAVTVLSGILDDIRIYHNRGFTPYEAYALYQNSLQGHIGLLRRVRRSPQPAPTAAPSGDVPIFMHHYLQMMGSR